MQKRKNVLMSEADIINTGFAIEKYTELLEEQSLLKKQEVALIRDYQATLNRLWDGYITT